MQTEFDQALTPEIEAVHSSLSRRNLEFLEFVRGHPECLERSTFVDHDGVGEVIGYPVQSWPTFIRRDKLAELAAINVGLCGLLKSVPRGVFGDDSEKLGRFYGLEPEHARIVTAALGNAAWVRGALARSDFYYTADGFKCLEFNIAGALGGSESSYWMNAVRNVPLIDRFLTEAEIELPEPTTLRRVVSHLLKEALPKFGSNEVNIGFLTPDPEANVMAVGIVNEAEEQYRRLLDELGGRVRGRVVGCQRFELVERQGNLYVDDTRLHALIDGIGESAGLDAHRCWLRGTVNIYNGPLAPVFSDKRNLALASELVDSDLWSREDRELIRAVVPWTRRVSRERVHPQSPEPITPELLIERQQRLVLKPATGSAGRDVHFGNATTEADWAEVVERAFAEGTWVVQERQESLPHLYQLGERGWALFDVVWGFFVFGETFGGTFLRMASKAGGGLVNVARGAVAGWVFEIDDPAE